MLLKWLLGTVTPPQGSEDCSEALGLGEKVPCDLPPLAFVIRPSTPAGAGTAKNSVPCLPRSLVLALGEGLHPA